MDVRASNASVQPIGPEPDDERLGYAAAGLRERIYVAFVSLAVLLTLGGHGKHVTASGPDERASGTSAQKFSEPPPRARSFSPILRPGLDSQTRWLAASSSAGGYICMSTNREKCPWNATVIVSVGPLRCLATMRSASPARGDSFS